RRQPACRFRATKSDRFWAAWSGCAAAPPIPEGDTFPGIVPRAEFGTVPALRPGQGRLLRRRPARERGEAVAVRHLHLRQRLRIEYVILPDHAVEIKHIGRHRIDLLVAQR